jgi:hypothetical protein
MINKATATIAVLCARRLIFTDLPHCIWLNAGPPSTPV